MKINRLNQLLLLCLLPFLTCSCFESQPSSDEIGLKDSVCRYVAVAPYSIDDATALLLPFDGSLEDRLDESRLPEAINISWAEDAVIGQALQCSGDAQITMPSLPHLTNGFTVEAWLYLEPPVSDTTLLAAQGDDFVVGILAAGAMARPFMRIQTDEGSFFCRSESFLPYGCWFHAAFIYDPGVDNAEGELNILIHSQPARFPQGGSQRDVPRGKLRQRSDVLRLGENFSGRIDELRVSNRARAPHEITAPWLSGRTGDYVPFNPASVLPFSNSDTIKLIAAQAVPTFHSIGIYARYTPASFTNGLCRVHYREVGTADWRSGADLVNDCLNQEFRGSLLMLTEDTAYEIELEADSPENSLDRQSHKIQLHTRTWSDDVPISEERFLPAGITQEPLTISAVGRPDGWIRYRPPLGTHSEIAVGLDVPFAVCIQNSAYVIFENIVARGGRASAIRVDYSHNIRVRRCEFTEWGPVGRQGPHGRPVDENGVIINYVPAVNLMRACRQVVIEDCFIHHPNSTGGSWRYGHPVGPHGFLLGLDGSHNNVIRNNEIVGGENHWWNDAIEGRGNQYFHGGPYRDTDIYGNFIAFANDNAVELDGGQMNVRFWNNRMEAIYRSVSLSPNRVGPSYVFLNLDVNQGAEYFLAGSAIKVGSVHPEPGWSFVFQNTIAGFGGAGLIDQEHLDTRRGFRAVLRNNVSARTAWFRAADDLYPESFGKNAPVFRNPEDGDYRLAPDSPGAGDSEPVPWLSHIRTNAALDQGVFMDSAASSAVFPLRNSGIEIHPQQVNLCHIAGLASAQPALLEILMPLSAGISWYAKPTEAWIRCVPDTGATAVTPQTVQVQIDPETLTKPGLRRAALVFRTNTGLNRTVMCFVDTLPANPEHLIIEAESGIYTKAMLSETNDQAYGKKALRISSARFHKPEVSLSLPFEVPEAGRYFVWMRYRQPTDNPTTRVFNVTLNEDQEMQILPTERRQGWLWAMLAHPINSKHDAAEEDGSRECDPRAFRLTAGTNQMQFAPRVAEVELDCVVLTRFPIPPERTQQIIKKITK